MNVVAATPTGAAAELEMVMTAPMAQIAETEPSRTEHREEMLRNYYGLAVSLARRFAMKGGWGESVEDLTQVALVGLVNAIDRYDQSRGVPFAGFATATIVGEIKHHLRDRSWAVRPSRRVQDLYMRAQVAAEELTQELGSSPTSRDIAERVGVREEEVAEALEAGNLRRPTSLESQSSDDDERSLVVRLPVRDRGYEVVDDQLSVACLLNQLPERQSRMVRLRYIDGLTQNEIADRMRLSQAHVQRLLVRSLHQLRALAEAS
jgi:RNA polymerase sigma-B factor